MVFDQSAAYPRGTERIQPYPVEPSTNRMFSWFDKGGPSRARGRSVLKEAGVYTTVDTPDANRIAAAQEYYAGGHIYEVSDAVADALQVAGYTVADAGGYARAYAGGY